MSSTGANPDDLVFPADYDEEIARLTAERDAVKQRLRAPDEVRTRNLRRADLIGRALLLGRNPIPVSIVAAARKLASGDEGWILRDDVLDFDGWQRDKAQHLVPPAVDVAEPQE